MALRLYKKTCKMIKHNLLIIDDDIAYLNLLAESLKETFDISCARNLSVAEDLLRENIQFDIALVDEHIGHEKGFIWIKEQQSNNNSSISFIFYSGMAPEEALLKGLECGVDDFIAKLFSLLTLNSKLNKLIVYQDKINNFKGEIKSKIMLSMFQWHIFKIWKLYAIELKT